MKRRLSTILTVTVAAVLVSSLAYAAKKKLQTKSKSMVPDVSEVDLAADLLDAHGDHKHKLPKSGTAIKHGDEELKELAMAMELKK